MTALCEVTMLACLTLCQEVEIRALSTTAGAAKTRFAFHFGTDAKRASVNRALWEMGIAARVSIMIAT